MHQISLICVFLVGIWRQYYNISFQHSWIHQIAKFREKRNVRNFRTENALFGYFWAIIFENHWYIWNQHFRNGGIAKFCEETKMFKFRNLEMSYWVFLIKNAWFGYFCARIFWKTIVIIEISTLNFVYLQNFMKNQNCINLRPKMRDLGIFGLEFLNTIVIFEISTLEFVFSIF